MTSQNALPAGHRVRWYEIEDLIGHGALCHTYLATDHNLQRQVVIKEFFPGKICIRNEDFSVAPATAKQAQTFNSLRDNFLAEAKTLAQYRLENLVQVHTTFELNQTAYLVMTYEKGQTLASMIADSSAPLDQKVLLDILSPIVEGLSKVHNVHVIHGDINPSNIIVRHYGAPVLVDFGSSRSIASSMRWQYNRSLAGSCAPIELLNGTTGTPGAWSDIYALAAVLYHAVTQQSVISSMERFGAVGSGRRDPYKALSNAPKRQYDIHFLSAIDSALALQPAQRPQSVSAWEDSLRHAEDPFQTKPSVANNNALLPRKSGVEPLGVYRVSAEKPAGEGVSPAAVVASEPQQKADVLPDAIETPAQQVPELVPTEVIRKKISWSHAGVTAGIALLLVSGAYFGMANYPGELLQAADRTAVPATSTKLDPRFAISADDTAEMPVPLSVAKGGSIEPGQTQSDEAQSDPVTVMDEGPTSASVPESPPIVAAASAAIEPGPQPEATTVSSTSDSSVAGAGHQLNSVAIPETFPEAPQLSAQNQLRPSPAASELSQLTQLLASIDCGSITPAVGTDQPDGVITQAAFENLRAETPETSALLDDTSLVVLDDVFCSPLSVLKDSIDLTRVSMTAEGDNYRFKEGDRLILNLAVSAFETNYLYVDYFTMDGSVLHMLSSKTTLDDAANQLLLGESMLLGEPGDVERWDLAKPYGNELVSILVSDSPLDIETTDEVEDAGAYLARIDDVLSSGDYEVVTGFIPITIEK